MTHISSIGAGVYTRILMATQAVTASTVPALSARAAEFVTEIDPASAIALATTKGTFTYIPDMREGPSFGTPPNLVNVPQFGLKTALQIQGQSDPTNFEITINYRPSAWTGARLGKFVGDGFTRLFCVALLNAEPPGYSLGATATADLGISVYTGSADVGPQNDLVFFLGELAAISITPNLTDSNQATVTVALKSGFSDPVTYTRTAAAAGTLAA